MKQMIGFMVLVSCLFSLSPSAFAQQSRQDSWSIEEPDEQTYATSPECLDPHKRCLPHNPNGQLTRSQQADIAIVNHALGGAQDATGKDPNSAQ